jgi:hypothetical protein
MEWDLLRMARAGYASVYNVNTYWPWVRYKCWGMAQGARE